MNEMEYWKKMGRTFDERSQTQEDNSKGYFLGILVIFFMVLCAQFVIAFHEIIGKAIYFMAALGAVHIILESHKQEKDALNNKLDTIERKLELLDKDVRLADGNMKYRLRHMTKEESDPDGF